MKSDGVKNGKVLSKTSRTGNDSDVSEKKKRFSASGSSPVKETIVWDKEALARSVRW